MPLDDDMTPLVVVLEEDLHLEELANHVAKGSHHSIPAVEEEAGANCHRGWWEGVSMMIHPVVFVVAAVMAYYVESNDDIGGDSDEERYNYAEVDRVNILDLAVEEDIHIPDSVVVEVGNDDHSMDQQTRCQELIA